MQAPLINIAARLHPHFERALTNRRRVAELGRMPNTVLHVEGLLFRWFIMRWPIPPST
jgi:hypothetical protein